MNTCSSICLAQGLRWWGRTPQRRAARARAALLSELAAKLPCQPGAWNGAVSPGQQGHPRVALAVAAWTCQALSGGSSQRLVKAPSPRWIREQRPGPASAPSACFVSQEYRWPPRWARLKKEGAAQLSALKDSLMGLQNLQRWLSEGTSLPNTLRQ